MHDISHAAFIITAQSSHSISTFGVATAAEALAKLALIAAAGGTE